MFACRCLQWNTLARLPSPNLESFSLPEPIPQWPPGRGFATGRIKLGKLEVVQIRNFRFIWEYNLSYYRKKGVSFYRPVGVPEGFHVFGHYCQPNAKPLRGVVLAARELCSSNPELGHAESPALVEPIDYTLIWCSNDLSEEHHGDSGFFWLPQAPEGYKAMGYVVTTTPAKPAVHEVRCVRANLTDKAEAYKIITNAISRASKSPIWVWQTRPSHRGMVGRGVPVGTFVCSTSWVAREELETACLINLDHNLHAMPNLDQIHALINHYGPTVFFHPEERFLPSSVSWFFKNGALLYRKGDPIGEAIEPGGSNLPPGGTNDGEFWIDLPDDDARRIATKHGNLESAKLYAHIKPALGGTFTDIAMWIFCPFNGPATIKVGIFNIPLGKIGQHACDWEHFTLRISNFSGELWSIYFSQHSGGEWVEACDLEYIQGNKAVIYSSKCGHASFPRPGTYLQGSSTLGLGIRNDAARSELSVDSSVQYEIVAAEYLGEEAVTEPGWLQFMRKWGPRIVYDSRSELDRIVSRLSGMLRCRVARILSKLPGELYGEDGPTGPKEKNNWVADERG